MSHLLNNLCFSVGNQSLWGEDQFNFKVLTLGITQGL